jgi:hypothetical protein
MALLPETDRDEAPLLAELHQSAERHRRSERDAEGRRHGIVGNPIGPIGSVPPRVGGKVDVRDAARAALHRRAIQIDPDRLIPEATPRRPRSRTHPHSSASGRG